jgi:uncharacterized repeat protein (TIGR01451 family)
MRPPVAQPPCWPCATPQRSGGIAASVEWDERISPSVDCNPVRTQHTLVVTVRDACGHPLPGQRVEWILARHAAAVGDIVAVDDQYGVGAIAPLSGPYAATNGGNKIDNQYAVSVTNFEDELLDAANNYPYVDASGQRLPDFRVGPGQSWITLTSVVEGVTDVIAYVPGIKDGARHKIFAKKIWADYEVVYPPDAVNLLPAATHPFVVQVRKASDQSGLAGTTIEAEVLDGPDATFDGGGKLASQASGPDGRVTFTLRNAAGAPGTNRIRLTARGRFNGAECPRSQIVRKTWQKVALECRCAVSAAQADVGDPVDVTYTVTNTGDAAAENVSLSVAPPAGLQVADGSVFPLSIGSIPGGGTAQKTVRFTAVAEGTQGLSFSASSPTGGATTACGCSIEIVRGRMEIACRCEPGTVDVGHPIQIVGTVSNTGRGTLRNVTLQLAWPEGMTPQTQNVVTVAEIPPGRTAPEQFVFQGLPTRPGKFPATVRATADGLPEQTSSCECAAVQCALQVQLICPGRIGFGEPGNFTVKVTNAGDGAANGCSVRVVHGPCLDGGTQDFPLGTIAPGQTVAHDWTSAGTANAKCTVTAEVNCQGCTARTECEVEVTGLPALQTEMVDQDVNHQEKGIFRVGEEFLYVLEVQNDVGTEATPPLRIQLDLPPEIQFVSGTSSRGVTISGSGAQATSNEFRLDVNEKLTVEFRVKAVAVPPGNLVKASATIKRASDGADLAQEIESTTVK